MSQAGGCGGKANNSNGVSLDGDGNPTAPYVLSLDSLDEGAQGCYWIAATPLWGINADSLEVALVKDANLDGGIFLAVSGAMAKIRQGKHAWIWVSKSGLGSSAFSEMYFDRRTRGVPR